MQVSIFEFSVRKDALKGSTFNGEYVDLKGNGYKEIEFPSSYNTAGEENRRDEISRLFRTLESTGLFETDIDKECFTMTATESEFLSRWKARFTGLLETATDPDASCNFARLEHEFYNMITARFIYDGQKVMYGTEFVISVIKSVVGVPFYIGRIARVTL